MFQTTNQLKMTEISSIVFPFCPSTQLRREIEMDIGQASGYPTDGAKTTGIPPFALVKSHPGILCPQKKAKRTKFLQVSKPTHIQIRQFWRYQPSKTSSKLCQIHPKFMKNSPRIRKIPAKVPSKSMVDSPQFPTRRWPRRRARRRVRAHGLGLGQARCLRQGAAPGPERVFNQWRLANPWGYPKNAGWFISWKIQSING